MPGSFIETNIPTGLRLAARYELPVYDAMRAAALTGDCDVLWSEERHHGLVIENRLRIANPFHPATG